jgi:hypothetical protein
MGPACAIGNAGAFSSRYEAVVSVQLLPLSTYAMVTRRRSFLVFPPILIQVDLVPVAYTIGTDFLSIA